MPAIRSKAQIRNANDLKSVRVDVPEWAEEGQDPRESYVLVRGLTAEERDVFDGRMWNLRKGKLEVNWEEYLRNVRARWVVLACVDEDGNRLFADEDAEWLGEKSAAPVDRIADAARKLSGATKEEEEDTGKDFGRTRTTASPSVLRLHSESPEEREKSLAY